MMIETGNREQVLHAYRQVREMLFRKVKTRFRMEGGPTV
jgi:hypothetical protein